LRMALDQSQQSPARYDQIQTVCQEMVHHASVRFAHTMRLEQESIQSASASGLPAGITSLRAVENNDLAGLHGALQQRQQEHSSTSGMSLDLMWIREPPAFNDFTSPGTAASSTLDRESGIILYNYGLTCFLLSCKTTVSAQQCEIYHSVACKSLITAHTAFARWFQTAQGHGSASITGAPLPQQACVTKASPASFTSCASWEAHSFAMLTLSYTVQVLRAGNLLDMADRAEQTMAGWISPSSTCGNDDSTDEEQFWCTVLLDAEYLISAPAA